MTQHSPPTKSLQKASILNTHLHLHAFFFNQAQEWLRGARGVLEHALRVKEQLGDRDGHTLGKALLRTVVANTVALAQVARALGGGRRRGEGEGEEARARGGGVVGAQAAAGADRFCAGGVRRGT